MRLAELGVVACSQTRVQFLVRLWRLRRACYRRDLVKDVLENVVGCRRSSRSENRRSAERRCAVAWLLAATIAATKGMPLHYGIAHPSIRCSLDVKPTVASFTHACLSAHKVLYRRAVNGSILPAVLCNTSCVTRRLCLLRHRCLGAASHVASQ